MSKEIGFGKPTCISTYESTCKKSIYEINKIKQEQGDELVIRSSYDQNIPYYDAFSAREINLENILNKHPEQTKPLKIFMDIPLDGLKTSDYLHLVESHIPEELISSQNFSEIKNLASSLNDYLTSFFGFETRLCDYNNRSDYMFAISSKRGEREALLNLFDKRKIPEEILKKKEWQRIENFVRKWTDSKTNLDNNIKSLWFEFDTSEDNTDKSIPNIFLHTKPIRIDTPLDTYKCKWINNSAVPLLTGQKLSKKIENNILNCIKMLPIGASILDIGIMIPRKIRGIRLVVNRLSPNQIIPYLESIGWSDNSNELSIFLKELEKYINRIVLSIDVGEKINSKIGIECRFFPDQYNLETGWNDFLDFLNKRGLCNLEKKSALLSFPGIEKDTNLDDLDFNFLTPIVKLTEDPSSNVIVRYISHIKISYKPNQHIEAKGYLGIRHFGIPYETGAIKK